MHVGRVVVGLVAAGFVATISGCPRPAAEPTPAPNHTAQSLSNPPDSSRGAHHVESPLDRDMRLNPEERAKEIDEHLDGVLKYDLEKFAKFDMTADQIEKASSVELVSHFMGSPMHVWFFMYDDPSVGIMRAIRGSQTLQAFLQRSDMIEAIVDFYKQINNEIIRLSPDSKVKGRSWDLMACDRFLLYPDVFEKTRGYERDFLRVLYERHLAMVSANSRFSKEKEPFGASLGSNVQLAIQLAKRIDPTGNWRQPKTSEEIEELIMRALELTR